MSGFGLSLDDLKSTSLHAFIDDNKEVKQTVNEKPIKFHRRGRRLQKRKITFTNSAIEDRERMNGGSDAVPLKKAKLTNISDMKPKPKPLMVRFLTGAISNFARVYNAVCLHTCIKITPPINFINAFAFYPPSPWKWYYLSYYNEEKRERAFGTAKHCYRKPEIRIEPVTDFKDPTRIAHVEKFLDRTETFIVPTESGNYLVCIKIKATKPNNKVLIVAHSNACDLGVTLIGYGGFFTSFQHPDDYDVYIFDYSGYGLSTGSPSEEVVYKDMEAVYDFVVKERQDPNLEIILFGISIGTAIVADFAAKGYRYITGAVLVAPLTSGIRHLAGNNPPKKTTSFDCFKTLDKVPNVRIPLLCIHGLNDTMMPPSNSAEIYAAAPYGVDPLFVPNRCHLGVLGSFRIGQRLTAFIEEDIENWKKGCTKEELRRTNKMIVEDFELDKDTESVDSSEKTKDEKNEFDQDVDNCSTPSSSAV